MLIQPYVSFEGRAEEAIRFYERALDARVEGMIRYGQSPEPIPPGMLPPGHETKVMHAALHVGDAVLLVSDGGCRRETRFGGVSIALTTPDVATARRFFEALADGGAVQMPLHETFFSPLFGMVADTFGLRWMVMSAGT